MTARRRRAWLVALCGAVCLLTGGVLAPNAHAGSYTVQYSDGLGCGMFVASSATGYLSTLCTPATSLEAPLSITGETTVAGGTEANISTTAPAGITITEASSTISEAGAVGSDGWGSGDFYTGGGTNWNGINGATTDPGFSSSEWGFQLLCSSAVASCAPSGITPPEVVVGSVTFQAVESVSPALSGGGLFAHTSGYVWNPAGDPWSLTAAGSDPSGTCKINATINGTAVSIEQQTKNPYAWQQCANGSWSVPVDTGQYVPTAGTLALGLTASDAATNSSSTSAAVKVDNDPVKVALSTPNDANPTVWVNHPVTVTAVATAGPSGISATDCAVDGGPTFAYPAGGFAVNGTGVHTVSCTAANNAVDPQGAHNTGSATEQIAIDQTPPAIGFAPVNPANPDQIVADVSDAQSGVGSGSITVQGPHQTTPTTIPSTLSGGQLVADYNDGGKNGNYTFVASSCDQVGNCASTSETLHFPIRLGTAQQLSFKRIIVPGRTVHKAVKLGGRLKTETRHEKVNGAVTAVKRTVRVHFRRRRVRIRVKTNQRCGETTIHYLAHHKRHARRVVKCRRMTPRIVAKHRQRLGRKVKLYGRVLTKQGAAVADVPVWIATRPSYPEGTWKVLKTVSTGPKGYWTTTINGGPSRIIRARYLGSATTEPATSKITLTVPAKIRLSIAPHVLPWSHAITITGHLVGTYVPHDGVALRLLVHYHHAKQWSVLEALRTNQHGAFAFTFSYGGGRGVVTYPFRIASTASETDYPYAAGSSRPVKVTFGRATPHHHHHRGRHATEHHRGADHHKRHRVRHRRHGKRGR